MTQGILLLAFNNEEIDYVELSIYCAQQIKKNLGKPVTLITDSKDWLIDHHKKQDLFDQVIDITDPLIQTKKFYDGTGKYKKSSWKNFRRADVYELSPYDETLVIDSDFIINSSFLNYCWDQKHDFLIYDKSNDLSGWRDSFEFEFINEFSVKFYWATVFFFRKTAEVKKFFKIVEHVRDNWNYYSTIYQCINKKFRNDFAFSIAIHMMNGFTNGDFSYNFANKLSYVLDRDFLIEHTDNKMKFLIQKKGDAEGYTLLSTNSLDVHVMNKRSLLRIIRA